MALAYIKLITSVLIFGSIGLFVKEIPMTSAEMVFMRTLLGGTFLTIIAIVTREKLGKEKFKENIPVMVLSGFFLGSSWLFLFEAYKNTTVSVATLTYYLAPVIVLIISPFLIDEKLTKRKIIGVVLALLGMALVNITGTLGGPNPKIGVICGLISALGYALVTVTNKKIVGVSSLVLTIVQLFSACLTIGLYLIITRSGPITIPTGKGFVYLLIIGVVHAGIALYFFFSALQELPAQTVAIFSYLDPLSALIFSAIFLGERLGPVQILGAVLILGGAAYGEISGRKKINNK